MLNRILVGVVGIPLLFLLFLKGGFLLLLFVNLVIGIGLFEFYKMSEIGGKAPEKILGYICGLMIPNLIYFKNFKDDSSMIIFPIVLLIITSILKRVLQNKVENSSRDIGITVLGVVYVSVLFSHVLLMNKIVDGGKWLLTIQVMVWLCDSFAYFVGMNIGRKIFKNGFSPISPKKSVEGFLGGVTFTILGVFLMNSYFNLFSAETSNVLILLFGLVISIIAQMGDLGESMFKREFKVKDSGRLLGEHGGILDRFDSMIFVVPVTYYLLKIFII